MVKGKLKILIIQTAFIGDVILALPIAQQLKKHYPDAHITFLLRKGNESLIQDHQSIDDRLIWDKKNKYPDLFRLIKKIRKKRFTHVINVQRFLSSGLISLLSKADNKIGFDKNPLSFAYDHIIKHQISKEGNEHEVSRNLTLLNPFNIKTEITRPQLFPSENDKLKVRKLISSDNYYVLAPASVWFTKQLQKEKWIELINRLTVYKQVYIIGSKDDSFLADSIIAELDIRHEVINFCGKLTLLQSAFLMENASQVFVNDSAPLHLASSVNANTIAFYCSTVPAFGFYPLSDQYQIAEVKGLECRPCGLHGKKECPKGHFKCSSLIDIEKLNINST